MVRFVPLALLSLAVGGELRVVAQDETRSTRPGGLRQDSASPENKGSDRWIRPSEGKAAEPVWGIKGSIAVGLWPTPGPRGLIRVYTPYLGQPRLRMINFIAIEPVVGNARGLSELEPSALDKTAGKAMWTGNELNLDPTQPPPRVPATGKVLSLEGTQALTFFLYVEAFNNHARPIVQITLRQDRPHEIAFKVYAAKGSAPMRSCVLTATMGNYARLRQLWLKDRVVESRSVWNEFNPDDWGFAPARTWNSERLLTAHGNVIVAATPNEANPARAQYAVEVPPWWRYEGVKATQYWQAPHQRGLLVRLNGRKTYWETKAEIPGGIAFENFELEAPFRPGQEFRFGVIPETPAKLGFGASGRTNIKTGDGR